MSIVIREARREEVGELIALLLLAEPSERALRWSLKNLSDAVYRMEDDGKVVGAATVRWKREPCEIVELAVAMERQGEGLGKRLVEWVLTEARRRAVREVFVGTSTTSISNIIFYQKCGFRPERIRRDYFWYYDQPHFEHGLPVRDMIVFRYDLTDEPPAS